MFSIMIVNNISITASVKLNYEHRNERNLATGCRHSCLRVPTNVNIINSDAFRFQMQFVKIEIVWDVHWSIQLWWKCPLLSELLLSPSVQDRVTALLLLLLLCSWIIAIRPRILLLPGSSPRPKQYFKISRLPPANNLTIKRRRSSHPETNLI